MILVKKNKTLIITALFIVILSLSLGFAAFSTPPNISSSASISPNSDTFGVKLSTEKDRLVVADVTKSSVSNVISATNGVIDNSSNPTTKNLSATFTELGQYVEYTFYTRNEG